MATGQPLFPPPPGIALRPARIATVGIHLVKQVKPKVESPIDPFEPPQSMAPDGDLPLAAKQARMINDKIVAHQGRSGAWFITSIISLLVGSVLAAPGKATTAWETWLINWRSNLLLYFAGASLILCLLHGARATFLHSRAKRDFEEVSEKSTVSQDTT
jgi:hypothetical protein